MTAHIPVTPAPLAGGFFPGLDQPAAPQILARRVVAVSWLLMGEGFPIIEDIEGAGNDSDLLYRLRLLLTELLAEVEIELGGADLPGEHRLAMAVEYGFSRVAGWSGRDLVQGLHLASLAADAAAIDHLRGFWSRLIAAYPLALVDPLDPGNQGAVLRCLRDWSALCTAVGVDTGFLKDMMRAV